MGEGVHADVAGVRVWFAHIGPPMLACRSMGNFWPKEATLPLGNPVYKFTKLNPFSHLCKIWDTGAFTAISSGDCSA